MNNSSVFHMWGTNSVVLILFCLVMCGCVKVPGGSGSYYQSLDDRLDQIALKTLFDAMALEFCKNPCVDGSCGAVVRSEQDGVGRPVSKNSCADVPSAGVQAGYGEVIVPGRRETLIVTDFVDLQSFEPKRSGLLMAELMRGSLHNVCCNRIVQGEFSKFFKMSEKGLVVLTRSVNDLKKDDYLGHHVVVGTYEYKRNKLIIFVKKVNIADGKIERMVSREIDFVRDTDGESTYQVK